MGFNYIILLEFIPLYHVILLKALLCSFELNTLDVGERSNFKNFLRTRKIHLGDA